jgi:hypothetical protein
LLTKIFFYSLYIYIYIERERERERGGGGVKNYDMKFLSMHFFFYKNMYFF